MLASVCGTAGDEAAQAGAGRVRQRGSSSCWSFLVLFPGLPPQGVRGVRGYVDAVFFHEVTRGGQGGGREGGASLSRR